MSEAVRGDIFNSIYEIKKDENKATPTCVIPDAQRWPPGGRSGISLLVVLPGL